MKLSQQAWEQVESVIAAIIAHPFNQELMQGTLAPERFFYYLEQDLACLQAFVDSATLLASRFEDATTTYALLRLAENSRAHREVIHQLFASACSLPMCGYATTASVTYASHLRCVTGFSECAVAIAALLPCLWVYHVVAAHAMQFSQPTNPFRHWITMHTDAAVIKDVDTLIELFDTLGAYAEPAVQKNMRDTFYKGVILEWHFWNDAYHLQRYDAIPIAHLPAVTLLNARAARPMTAPWPADNARPA